MSLRVVVAESGLARARKVGLRLAALGYDVVAEVATVHEALDAVTTLAPDALVLGTHLSDGLGVHTAITATRARAGTAALLLSYHPIAAERSARPNWGAVALGCATADDHELDADVRSVISAAQALALEVVEPEPDIEMPVEEPVAEAQEPAAEPAPAEAAPTGNIVERAVAQIVERTRLTPADALRLMEEEASEDGCDLVEVASAVLAEAAA